MSEKNDEMQMYSLWDSTLQCLFSKFKAIEKLQFHKRPLEAGFRKDIRMNYKSYNSGQRVITQEPSQGDLLICKNKVWLHFLK